ncbi:histidine phosphatase superfamily [Lipomyces doorenjongii]|uniref:histidine phosphatase superfamily n=1 Tax=Lipomyces doorenjongii TaxID=383834 RepID=UPI0034CF6AB1
MLVKMLTPSMLLSVLAIAFTVEGCCCRETKNADNRRTQLVSTTPNNYAAFLAQTNPAPFGQVAYVPNAPRQNVGTHCWSPVKGTSSTWAPTMSDPILLLFGVDEYSLPEVANITHAHVPTAWIQIPVRRREFPLWASGFFNATENGTVFEGDLSFLSDWSFKLGEEVLVPQGRKEPVRQWHPELLQLRPPLVVRSASQDRVLKSAENFLEGFFGLDCAEHAKLLVTIGPAATGVVDCTRYYEGVLSAFEQVGTWNSIYLKERTAKLRKLTGSYNWTVADTFYAQRLCPYETVALGYSDFCQLFTNEGWEGLDYYFDIIESGAGGFLSPTGRAYGIAWKLIYVPANTAGANMTLDMNPITFPVNQSLYLEFGHDGDIVAVMAAFGLTQFAGFLPATGAPAHQQFFSSKIVPFAGRLNIEIIKASHKVSARRSSKTNAKHDAYIWTRERVIMYIHSEPGFEACEYRDDDGWCELTTFMNLQKEKSG